MNCKNAQSLLSAYLDEELTGREMLDIRSHLSGCSACQDELKSVQIVKSMLGDSSVPAPSPGFEDRLVASVMAATIGQREQKKISLVTLAGIAAASMLGTMLMLNAMKSPSPAPAQHGSDMAYEMMQRDRVFSASSDPLSGSPVMMPVNGRK